MSFGILAPCIAKPFLNAGPLSIPTRNCCSEMIQSGGSNFNSQVPGEMRTLNHKVLILQVQCLEVSLHKQHTTTQCISCPHHVLCYCHMHACLGQSSQCTSPVCHLVLLAWRGTWTTRCTSESATPNVSSKTMYLHDSVLRIVIPARTYIAMRCD